MLSLKVKVIFKLYVIPIYLIVSGGFFIKLVDNQLIGVVIQQFLIFSKWMIIIGVIWGLINTVRLILYSFEKTEVCGNCGGILSFSNKCFVCNKKQ